MKNDSGKEYADEINAIFQNTSALSNTGIDLLFENLGKKLLDPSFDYKKAPKKNKENSDNKKTNKNNSNNKEKEKNGKNEGNKIKLKSQNNNKKEGKKCC